MVQSATVRLFAFAIATAHDVQATVKNFLKALEKGNLIPRATYFLKYVVGEEFIFLKSFPLQKFVAFCASSFQSGIGREMLEKKSALKIHFN